MRSVRRWSGRQVAVASITWAALSLAAIHVALSLAAARWRSAFGGAPGARGTFDVRNYDFRVPPSEWLPGVAWIATVVLGPPLLLVWWHRRGGRQAPSPPSAGTVRDRAI